MLGLEDGLTLAERLADRCAGVADPLPGVLAGLRRQRADLPVRERERGPVAGVVASLVSMALEARLRGVLLDRLLDALRGTSDRPDPEDG